MKLCATIRRTYDLIVNSLAVLGAVIIFLMMLAVSLGVGARFFLHRSPVWLIEICGYGMVFMTFLVAAWVLKEEQHVRIDLLLDSVNHKAREIIETIVSLIGAGVCLVISWYGIIVTLDHLQRGVRTPTDLSIPWAPLLCVIPIGALALGVQFLIKARAHFKEIRKVEI